MTDHPRRRRARKPPRFLVPSTVLVALAAMTGHVQEITIRLG